MPAVAMIDAACTMIWLAISNSLGIKSPEKKRESFTEPLDIIIDKIKKINFISFSDVGKTWFHQTINEPGTRTYLASRGLVA